MSINRISFFSLRLLFSSAPSPPSFPPFSLPALVLVLVLILFRLCLLLGSHESKDSSPELSQFMYFVG